MFVSLFNRLHFLYFFSLQNSIHYTVIWCCCCCIWRWLVFNRKISHLWMRRKKNKSNQIKTDKIIQWNSTIVDKNKNKTSLIENDLRHDLYGRLISIESDPRVKIGKIIGQTINVFFSPSKYCKKEMNSKWMWCGMSI